MADLTTPHDRLFRALSQDPLMADRMIRDLLPAAYTAHFSDRPARPADGTFLDDELRALHSDGLYEVDLLRGTPSTAYVLLEHKSTAERKTRFQIAHYMMALWDRIERQRDAQPLPLVIPLVVYHGSGRWNVPTSLPGMDDAPGELSSLARNLSCVVCNLGDIPFERLSEDALLRAGLGALKLSSAGRMPGEVLRDILESLSSPDGNHLLGQQIWHYVSVVHDLDRAEVDELMPKGESHLKEVIMPTLAETWRAEGVAKMLRIGLERRFGELPPEAEARIDAATSEELEIWGAKAFDAGTLDEVFESVPLH